MSVPWIGKRLLMIGRGSNRRIKLRGALIDVEKESTREVQFFCGFFLYTGDHMDIPEVLWLSVLYKGTGLTDVEMKVLRGNGAGNIVDQYLHRRWLFSQ